MKIVPVDDRLRALGGRLQQQSRRAYDNRLAAIRVKDEHGERYWRGYADGLLLAARFARELSVLVESKLDLLANDNDR